MTRLAGKRALVIGAGSVGKGIGNGRATAMLFAREGAVVTCADRNLEAAEASVSLISKERGTGFAMQLDATDPKAFETIDSTDILVHVVGMSLPGGAMETDPSDWDLVMNVNLRSAYLAARAVLPRMIDQGSGALVFVSSLASVWSSGYSYAAYEASKAGLNRLTSSLARAHAAQGIRVNAVLPGMIDTPHVKTFISDSQSASPEQRAAVVPMKRQGAPSEVAEAILFLASDAASYITGTCLRVDGGLGA